MANPAKGVPIKKSLKISTFPYNLVEDKTDVIALPAGPSSIVWAVDIKVDGTDQTSCKALQFGFIQKIERLNAHWSWGSRCEELRLHVPWWDTASGDPRSFWYDPPAVQTVNGCFDPKQPGIGIIKQLTFRDSPRPGLLQLVDPQQPQNGLTEMYFEAAFSATLVEVSPSAKPRALLTLPWSVLLAATFDVAKPIDQHAHWLHREVHAQEKDVTMGGNVDIALYERVDVAGIKKAKVVSCPK